MNQEGVQYILGLPDEGHPTLFSQVVFFPGELVSKALRRINTPIERARICVLGLAYKADIEDGRGAPGKVIAWELKQMGADVSCYDPLVIPEDQDIKLKASLQEAVQNVDCIVIATDHSAFKSLDLKSIAKLANHPLAIVDGRHVFTPKQVKDSGITYIGIGRTEDSELIYGVSERN